MIDSARTVTERWLRTTFLVLACCVTLIISVENLLADEATLDKHNEQAKAGMDSQLALELLDPENLLAMDAGGLKAAIGDSPAEWITRVRMTPLLSAADGWSCICGRMLQLEETETLNRWMGTLSGGPVLVPEVWLAADDADPEMPPHFRNAVTYGAAVSGCFMALDRLVDISPDETDAKWQELAVAAGVTVTSEEVASLNGRTLFDLFWPEVLARQGAAYQAFANQWREPAERLACQTTLRYGN